MMKTLRGEKMKLKLIVFLVLCFLVASCKDAFNPFASDWVKEEAKIIFSDFSRAYTSDGKPSFTGYAENIGNLTACECWIEIACYSDVVTTETTLIDVAKGFPANSGDIPPGSRAYYEAIAFNCSSHKEIKATTIQGFGWSVH
jgi:hypothetical protein